MFGTHSLGPHLDQKVYVAPESISSSHVDLNFTQLSELRLKEGGWDTGGLAGKGFQPGTEFFLCFWPSGHYPYPHELSRLPHSPSLYTLGLCGALGRGPRKRLAGDQHTHTVQGPEMGGKGWSEKLLHLNGR